jgi:hypothetical protein
LTKKDLDTALTEQEAAIRELTKANIMEMKQLSKPNPLVEKTLQIVCALKGFKSLAWVTARDFISKPSFKVELQQTSLKNNGNCRRGEDVYAAQQILV